MSQAFFKTLSGSVEATLMSCAPVVMLPQVPLSWFQPPVSAKPMPWVPQSLSVLSAPLERDSFLVEKQVCSQLPFSLSACALFKPFPLVNCKSGSSQTFIIQSQKRLRRSL